MIYIFIRSYINFTLSCVLQENYKLYKHIQNTDYDEKLSNICLFNSWFIGGIIVINSYYLFHNLNYYLN
jgi:hypothetical protein